MERQIHLISTSELSADAVGERVACIPDLQIYVDSNIVQSWHPGISAGGDVTDAVGKRIIIASGEGAKAALAPGSI